MGLAGKMVGLAIAGALTYKIFKKEKPLKKTKNLIKDLEKECKIDKL